MTEKEKDFLIEINKDNVQEIQEENNPNILYFSATWCRPCQYLKPAMQKLAKAYAGKVSIGTVQVDNEHALVKKYGIQKIPNLVFCKGDKEVHRYIGADGNEVEKGIKEHFNI